MNQKMFCYQCEQTAGCTGCAEAFGCGVNDLPLTLVLSWYEQKAVCILLSLLYLGIQNIHLGPTLPAFISPNVLKLLAEKFHLTFCGEEELRHWDQAACKIGK